MRQRDRHILGNWFKRAAGFLIHLYRPAAAAAEAASSSFFPPVRSFVRSFFPSFLLALLIPDGSAYCAEVSGSWLLSAPCVRSCVRAVTVASSLLLQLIPRPTLLTPHPIPSLTICLSAVSLYGRRRLIHRQALCVCVCRSHPLSVFHRRRRRPSKHVSTTTTTTVFLLSLSNNVPSISPHRRQMNRNVLIDGKKEALQPSWQPLFSMQERVFSPRNK